jgi:hypothetical protein
MSVLAPAGRGIPQSGNPRESHMECNCSAMPATEAGTFVSIPVPSANSLVARAQAMSLAPAAADTHQVIHMSASGDQVLSTSFVKADGQGNVEISGQIGLISVDLKIGVAINDTDLTLTLQLIQPIQIGPLQWTFQIAGRALHPMNAPAIAPMVAQNNTILCILQCAGDQILPILTACLFQGLFGLVGGPAGAAAALIQCVISKLADNAGPIAQCIATKCK